jgi:hypothetical protein
MRPTGEAIVRRRNYLGDEGSASTTPVLCVGRRVTTDGHLSYAP